MTMLNNYAIVVGFMKFEPQIQEDQNKNSFVYFVLSTLDHGKTKEITCIATGKLCDILLIYGQKGSFWAIGGVFSDTTKEHSKNYKMALKCVEIELLKKPEVPGIGVEEFVGKYSPKEIIKRAKEKRQ